MGVDDDYTAFCFNEACAFIMGKLDANEEPSFQHKYTSFSEIYAKYE